VVLATDGAEAVAALDGVDVVITDLRMPRLDGMEVLRTAMRTHPHVPIVMMTAHGSVGHAVEAIKAGAFDYIEKPFEQEQIRAIVDKAVRQAAANRAAPQAGLYPPTDDIRGRFGLVGDSAEMHGVFDGDRAGRRLAVDGADHRRERHRQGAGRQGAARGLDRKGGPFIKINCAAIPKTLMESELFGYEKGAFTGATTSKPGRFELADGGTLFLDEIGEIPVEMQVKLLRAIQESEFERVGGLKTIKVDVRLITATNRDLEQEIARGNFREDLYYRLNVVPLQIPPLRRRAGDVPLLVRHILKRFNERLKKNVAGISDDAMAVLAAYAWPGNIRELENVLERTILFCKREIIAKADLPDELCAAATAAAAPAAPRDELAGDDAVDLAGDASLKDIVRAETSRVEKEFIAKALAETGGNVTQAAKLLKISRKSLQMKMKEFGLRDTESGGVTTKD
jgi:two-component system response regulator AtoC